MTRHTDFFNDSKQQISQLVKQYCHLATLPELSSEETENIAAISELGIYDSSLNYWLSQADQLIDYQLGLGTIPNYDWLVSSLSIHNLAYKLMQVPSHQVKFEDFKKLIDKTKLQPEFLKPYKSFNPKHFSRQAIFQTTNLTIYMIGWQPGQCTDIHHHGQSLDAIRVYQGEMTHCLVNQEHCQTSEDIFAASGKVFTKNQLVCIDRKKYHAIANKSAEILLTLHFRFGAPPDSEENWKTSPDECKSEATWSLSNSQSNKEECRLLMPT